MQMYLSCSLSSLACSFLRNTGSFNSLWMGTNIFIRHLSPMQNSNLGVFAGLAHSSSQTDKEADHNLFIIIKLS